MHVPQLVSQISWPVWWSLDTTDPCAFSSFLLLCLLIDRARKVGFHTVGKLCFSTGSKRCKRHPCISSGYLPYIQSTSRGPHKVFLKFDCWPPTHSCLGLFANCVCWTVIPISPWAGWLWDILGGSCRLIHLKGKSYCRACLWSEGCAIKPPEQPDGTTVQNVGIATWPSPAKMAEASSK